MPNARAARRPIPPEMPGWVVWLLGLNLPETNKRLVWITILGSAITVAAAANTAPGRPLSVAGAWAITMVMVALVCAAMGLQRLYRVGGILINERFVMSLTRFQITAWTIMIGSAILTIGMARAFHPEVNGVTEALARAGAAIKAGFASTVLCVMADVPTVEPKKNVGYRLEFEDPYGPAGPPGLFGMIVNRYKHQYGDPTEAMCKIAMTQRRHAEHVAQRPHRAGGGFGGGVGIGRGQGCGWLHYWAPLVVGAERRSPLRFVPDQPKIAA